MVDSHDKLKLHYNSDFFADYNGSLWLNIGPGLTRDSNNKMSIALVSCNLKFVNNQLCLDMDAVINNSSGSIGLDDKKRLELNYSSDDFMKDSTGKLWLKLDHKYIVRTIHGLQLNIDNDTIRYDSNSSKLISSIDKYLGLFGQIYTGDIYLDSNKNLRLNINNYIDDNVGTKVIMNTRNKIDLDIVDQQSGEIYFNNNKLTLRLGNFFSKDSSGHFFAHVNQDHGLNWRNYQLNLDISPPLSVVNKKLTLDYNPYFKITNNQLDLDITKLKTDIAIPKQNEGILLNHDGMISIDRNILTSMINVSNISGLKILSNQIIIDEDVMFKNLIRLNSNSSIVRRANKFFELNMDRISIDFDFNTGNLKIKDGYISSIVDGTYIKNHINSNYVKSIINKDYIKDNIINQSWYRDANIFNGVELLKIYSLCSMKLNDLSMVVKNTNRSNNVTTISTIGKIKYKDIDYFECFNNIVFYYRHYTGLLFNDNTHDNHIVFNTANQYICYVEHCPKMPTNQLDIVCMFNFVFEFEKKSVDINSTLWDSSDGKSYIKILYNNSGIIYRFNENEG